MTTPFQVVDKCVEVLENNLTDINQSRRKNQGKWIFNKFPKFDEEMPRIGFIIASSTAEPKAVNSDKRLESLVIQCTILVDSNNEFKNPETQKTMGAEEAIDYLGDKVVNNLNRNPTIQAMDDVHYIVFTDERGGREITSSLVPKNLDFQVLITRGVNHD